MNRYMRVAGMVVAVASGCAGDEADDVPTSQTS